ncbi:DUF1579 family protein [Fulvimonas sp. R45]|uniref:DUF1579 family protein n=1 Tax=Fulvimonas sp. R45 TaxID=3045937 RepID=UPI00266038E9|nr:DUF1579 family protein [Fulvimonas sp. R45]MDO1527860.1 DUF1579 family protein [Fulvimonas sp. R45]
MRQRRLLSLALVLTAGAFACAGAAITKTGPAPAGGHAAPAQRLDWLAGRWNVRQSFWTDPARAPAVDTGTAVFTRVLEGRHLRQEVWIDSAKPFHGLGYLGYDAAAHRYDSLWMDVNFGGVVIAHGDCDPAGRACTFLGAVPGAHGSGVPVREVLQVADADHFSYAYYERHAGREVLTVKLDYARVK